ncbi:MAG: 3'-5' exonuclease [bacterium]|nr:3'-5' exonuclease [bacterium]
MSSTSVTTTRLAAFLSRLNPEQRAAVSAPEGPALVLAGAGSGKTRVLTGRAFYLMEACRVDPRAMIVVTFTNKAAEELRNRLRTYVGSQELPWAGTFHAFCARLLRQHGSALNLPPHFSIYDTADSEQVLGALLSEHRIGRDALTPSVLRGWISLLKNGGRLSGRHPLHGLAMELRQVYDVRLRDANAVDFDDLLRLPLEMFRTNPRVLETLQHRYDHILIDEFQDTNRHQYELARDLARPQNNLYVVGDDDQSIYGWRGADFRNLFNFRHDLPGARLFQLEQNYRSTQPILDVANDVISAKKSREAKRLWTPQPEGERVTVRQTAHAAEEAYEVVGEIEQLMRREGYSFRDFAILYRANSLSRSFEEVLVNRAIPYALVGGTRFYERKEVKDLIAYLRLLVNPEDDQACRRVLRNPPRGIGDVTIQRLADAAAAAQCGMGTILLNEARFGELPAAIAKRLLPLSERLQSLSRRIAETNPVQAIEWVLESSGLMEFYRELDDTDSEERQANLQQLVAAARDRCAENTLTTLADFLTEVALVSDVDEYEEIPDRVSLMTIHSAKGLEFPVVFVVALEDGILPHARSRESQDELDEERRLLYVAITRARERLSLSFAQNRYRNGVVTMHDPSPFLRDIAPEHLRGWTLPAGRMEREHQGENGSHGSETWQRERIPSLASSLVPFKIGDVVEHPEFGIGVVTAKSGEASDLKVRIAFEGMGSKLLAVKFAPLKKLN